MGRGITKLANQFLVAPPPLPPSVAKLTNLLRRLLPSPSHLTSCGTCSIASGSRTCSPPPGPSLTSAENPIAASERESIWNTRLGATSGRGERGEAGEEGAAPPPPSSLLPAACCRPGRVVAARRGEESVTGATPPSSPPLLLCRGSPASPMEVPSRSETWDGGEDGETAAGLSGGTDGARGGVGVGGVGPSTPAARGGRVGGIGPSTPAACSHSSSLQSADSRSYSQLNEAPCTTRGRHGASGSLPGTTPASGGGKHGWLYGDRKGFHGQARCLGIRAGGHACKQNKV